MGRDTIHSIVEFEVQGKQRGFRNDSYAQLIACRKDGLSLTETLANVRAGDTLSFMHLMYGLAVSYQESKSRVIDFTANDMEDWLKEIGPEKMREYITAVFKTPEQPKNSESPKETGVTVP